MVAFAFLGNTLFLTILVSMLSNTFSTIVANASAEIQYRKSVLTLEGVKSDAIFAYQPPFNILAIFVILPLKFFLNPRWFHKVHVTAVRTLNLPLLLVIAVLERRSDWTEDELDAKQRLQQAGHSRFWWQKWSSHASIQSVFDMAPPESFEEEIAVDDDFSHNLIRREFTRTNTNQINALKAPNSSNSSDSASKRRDSLKTPSGPPSRRDSLAPFPGLAQQLRGILSESDQVTDITNRLEALEESTSRIEAMLTRLCSAIDDDKEPEDIPEAE